MLSLGKVLDKMKEAELLVREMIEKIPSLAWSCQPDGTADFLNQRWLDYTGLSTEEAVGWGWQAAIHSEDLGKLMDTGSASSLLESPGRSKSACDVSMESLLKTSFACMRLSRAIWKRCGALCGLRPCPKAGAIISDINSKSVAVSSW